ncbi:uncharacterized protein K489DRAFT_175675 [Dissoconium aciculare CBS 342.82]|uniref:Uncharacterized protein n=1 Tax=Dissoconium aciculare CBS 342.82 TaxID=1314786 RepID=A0A6J3MBF0_9PEZI|nr:uncharacterized protein K489DRAFT_175675 [Dissoconium aciculare CBS 342.82]KAF1824157.1 hypothetical protein K489DRAFT_175675 [Dissoconium aciculare CBS 342.82]
MVSPYLLHLITFCAVLPVLYPLLCLPGTTTSTTTTTDTSLSLSLSLSPSLPPACICVVENQSTFSLTLRHAAVPSSGLPPRPEAYLHTTTTTNCTFFFFCCCRSLTTLAFVLTTTTAATTTIGIHLNSGRAAIALHLLCPSLLTSLTSVRRRLVDRSILLALIQPNPLS